MAEKSFARAEKTPRLSEVLMDYLLREQFYEQAAELVLGSEAAFEMYCRQIDEVIEDMKRWPGRITFERHVKPLADRARSEIQFELAWSQDVLARLPKTAATAAIKNSFIQTAKARVRLLEKLLKVHDTQQKPLSPSESGTAEGA